MSDWSPTDYAQYYDLRLLPARDLLTAVGDLPEGRILDLGCGSGGVGHLFKEQFPGRTIDGIENSPAMREAAQATGVYNSVEDGDLAAHDLGTENALIFTNAALNWVKDHRSVLPRIVEHLVPGGWFAMQVPSQHEAPSHALARDVATKMDPEAFPDADANSNVLPPRSYASMLAPFGDVRVWMTEYMQELTAPFGHPVRHFTQATYLRPYLNHFEAQGRLDDYVKAYETELNAAYPINRQGQAWFPFKRLFVTLHKT
ncbi:methyltransferase domain-containing protein [Celeribacter litoreus]|uniref:methyltransferase domain-containing protein n=1 Tax=Celeribacter litoreus TaxID=2876714 RepID=UPI001CC9AA05|nr:methyltransferase domain-containing protein [Celeribacter litoreus]MCA0044035.1 methyltransferase domain-containing protein [Celeribacter litoreus]